MDKKALPPSSEIYSNRYGGCLCHQTYERKNLWDEFAENPNSDRSDEILSKIITVVWVDSEPLNKFLHYPRNFKFI